MILRVSTSLIALVAATSMAAAADLPIEPAPVEPMFVPPAPMFTWDGFYVGVSGGYAWGDIDLGDSAIAGPGFIVAGPLDASFDADGWLIGGTIGYNAQFDQFVFGVEADLSYTDIEETVAGTVTDLIVPGDVFTAAASAELRWLGTVRARAGFALDRFMIYATGGLAVGGGKASVGFDYTAPGIAAFGGGDSDTNTHVGYTVGGGVEGAITDNLTAKLEYLYVDLGKETYSGNIGGLGVATEADFEAHVVRAGLNYKFSF